MPKRTINTDNVIQAARAAAGDRLRREYTGRIGRTFDSAIATGNANEVYVRIEGDTEATAAVYPTGTDLAAIEYDAPVRLKRVRGVWVVTGFDASEGAAFFEGAPPANSWYNQSFIIRTASTALPNATALGSLASGYLKSTTTSGAVTTQATPIPLSDGGTGANLASAQNGAVVKSGTALTTRLDKLNATTAPTVNDDSGDGYSVGSQWIDTTNDKAYVCVDASVGAAVWVEQGGSSISLPLYIPDGGIGNQITPSTRGTVYAAGAASLYARKDMEQSAPVIPTVNDDSGDGYAKASYWLNHSASNAFFVCTDETAGAAVWLEAGVPLSNPQNWVYAAPTSGSGRMTVRALVSGDIPNLAASKITSGTFDAARIPTLSVSNISNASGALISSQTLGASATSISFTSIPSTYSHLELILFLRSDNAGTGELAIIRINADTTAANYFSMRGVTSHSASTSTAETLGATTGGIVANAALGNGATAGHYGVFRVLIPRYSAAVKHTLTYDGFRLISTTTGNLQETFGGGIHTTAAAITQIDVLPNTGTNWLTGSQASLIGLF